MSLITILHQDSTDNLALVREAKGLDLETGGTNYNNHVVFSKVPEIEGLTVIDLRSQYDENGDVIAGPVFDATTLDAQLIDSRAFIALVADDAVNFPPEEEDDPEPRYKLKMTSAEFTRDLLTQAEWAAIETAAQSDATVGAWRDVTISGEVWVGHIDFQAGLALGMAKGIWDQERADEISKGLLIT